MLSVARWFLALALWVCPREFRRTYGTAIRADFRETIGHEYERGGGWACAIALCATFADILATGLVERARTLGRDLLFALRSLRKTPFFAAVIIATLAVAIAATTAAFSVVDGVLLRPLPYPQARSLVAIQARSPYGDVFSYPNYADLRRNSGAFAAIGAVVFDSATLTGNGPAQVLTGVHVSPSFFDVFGVRAEIGRLVAKADSRPGSARVVILSDALYRSHFAADPTIVGRSIVLDGESYRVIGVAPPGLQVPQDDALLRVDYWTTIGPNAMPTTSRDIAFLSVYAKLREGRSLASADADTGRIMATLAARYPATNRGFGAAVVPLAEKIVGPVRSLLVTVAAAVGAVLLVACTNVANLILSRAAARERELAIRCAIGATRARIIAQILTETLLLASAGGIIGMLLATTALHAFIAWQPAGIPRLTEITFDTNAALVAVALVGLCTIAAGLVPALIFSRAPLEVALRAAGRASVGSRGERARATFVIAQIAVTLILVVASALVLRSYAIMTSTPLGFDAEGVTVVKTAALTNRRYATATQQIAFAARAVEQAAALPGAIAAAYCAIVPFSGRYRMTVSFPDRHEHDGLRPSIDVNVVSPGYFAVMQIPLVRGRVFNAGDRLSATPAVIVNTAFARRYFRGNSAIGKTIAVDAVDIVGGERNAPATTRTIVGITADTRSAYTEPAQPEVYLAIAQTGPLVPITLLIRSHPSLNRAEIGAAIGRVDPEIAIADVSPLAAYLAATTERTRLTAIVLGTLAGIALFLAGAGIYAVVSYGVAQRTHEFGVRRALGARPGHVIRDVVMRAARLAALGIATGIILAAFTTRFVADQLYGIGLTDPPTYIAVIGAILAVTLVAAVIPAVRAMRVDPIVALRYE